MTLSTQNGFSEKEIDQCKGWQLPEVSNGATIPVTVNKKKEKALSDKNRVAVKDKEKQTADNNEAIEVIEDVDLEAVDENAQAISAEELAKITEQAEKEGYQAGFEKGQAEGQKEGLATGLSDAKQAIVDQSQRLQHIIDALLTPLENEKKQLEHLLVDMTCRLTETLLERELKTDSSIITQHIDAVLTLLPKTIPAFTLFLNPDDIRLVEEHLQQTLVKESVNSSVQYQLKADESLMVGGCRLESNQTSVDASMEVKLSSLLNSFVEKRHEKNPVEPEETMAKTQHLEEDSQKENLDEDKPNE